MTNFNRVSLIGACVIIGATATGFDITPNEREQATRLIDSTNRKLFASIDGLTPEQWNFKAAPDRWSAAETLEHLTIIQDAVLANLAKLPQAAAAPERRDVTRMDAEILSKVADRTEKYQAPPQAIPAARWTPAEALAHYKESNAKLRAALDSVHDLRGHVVNHPLFGPWDGYQWILAGTGHTARHTDQILEVKATAGYPATR